MDQTQPTWRGRLICLGIVVACALFVLIPVMHLRGCDSALPREPGPDIEMPLTYQGGSEGLKHTAVLPTLDTPMPKGKNVIWCAAFQLAWNRLEADVIEEPVAIVNAEEVAKRLNRAGPSEADLPPDSCYAAAGYVSRGIAEKIVSDMAAKFPAAPAPEFPDAQAGDIIAYGYLAARVRFSIPYFENTNDLLFRGSAGKETAVDSFGIRPEDDYAYENLRHQVDVLYSSRARAEPRPPADVEYEEFAVDPCKYSEPNQIILARIEPKPTLEETLADLEAKISAHGQEGRGAAGLGPRDVLLVPNMFWDITHHFPELEGKPLANVGFTGLFVSQAMQSVQFRLDRSGAELEAEAKVHMRPARTDYVFDRPFLILMRKRGAEHPFFVMWVDNAELLSRRD